MTQDTFSFSQAKTLKIGVKTQVLLKPSRSLMILKTVTGRNNVEISSYRDSNSFSFKNARQLRQS